MAAPTNLDELEQAFRRLEAALPAIVLRQTEVAANDTMGLVDQRISETGKDERGNNFAPYTKAYQDRKSGVSARKSASGKARRRTKAEGATAEKPVGSYTGFVNFTLTGQMLNSTATGLVNITKQSANSTGVNATVIIGPRDEETRKKVEGNDKKRPGFLNPSTEEVKRVEVIRSKRIEEMIQDEFFA